MSARDLRLAELALKQGRIITPVSPAEYMQGVWTRFTDIWAGGCAKEPWDYIYIQAPVPVACRVFEHVFDHDPRNYTCACCGEEYEVSPADGSVDYPNSLFIKAADILVEWTEPLEDPHEKEVHFPGGVTIKHDDLFKSPFTEVGVDGVPKSALDADYEALLQQNIKVLTSAFAIPETSLETVSAGGLAKAAANFGLPYGKAAEFSTQLKKAVHEIPADKIKISVSGAPISFTNPPMKDVLPPGMHYAYDDIAAKQKQKKKK